MFDYMVPGILVILVTLVGLFLSGMNVVREKEIGTIDQINVTPMRRYQFIPENCSRSGLSALESLPWDSSLPELPFMCRCLVATGSSILLPVFICLWFSVWGS